jgi:hypothetical protein
LTVEGRIPEMPKSDWVFWLNITNITLGVVVVLAVLLVASAVVWEIASRHKKPAVAAVDDRLDNLLPDGRMVPGLGMTMADGGERIKTPPEKSTEKKSS